MSTNPKHLRPPLTNIHDILIYFAQRHADVNCIQVGANDGISHDPIHSFIVEYKWKSILLEPQPWVFENKLTKTYKGYDNVFLENAAIGNTKEELPFYMISFTNQTWATGLAGFDRKCLEDHIESGYVDRKSKKNGITPPDNKENYIKEVKVSIKDFDSLIEKYNFDKIDILCIDTEGYDYEVLKLFDFNKYQPKIVIFESKNLDDDIFIAAKDLLKEHGYQLFWQGGNTLAIKIKYPWWKQAISKTFAFLDRI